MADLYRWLLSWLSCPEPSCETPCDDDLTRKLLEIHRSYLDCQSQELTVVHAIRAGHLELVRCFLENGTDPDFGSVLHIAAEYQFDGILPLLLDYGADVTKRNSMGWTPLHAAANCNNEAAVQLLLARGAPPSAKTKKGETAMDLAVKRGYKGVCSILRKHYGLPPVAGRNRDLLADQNIDSTNPANESPEPWPEQRTRHRTGQVGIIQSADGAYWN